MHRSILSNVSSWRFANIAFVSLATIRRAAQWAANVRKSGTLAMDPVVNKLYIVLASITNSMRKIFGTKSSEFASQRMCPFCGLITPRRKACCLECGKSLKPA